MSTIHAIYPRMESDSKPTQKPITQKVPSNINPRLTPSILSLPIKDSGAIVSIYENCLKPLYTLNVVLLDKLHNRSSFALLLVHLHEQLMACFGELNSFKNVIKLSRAGGSSMESVSRHCFIRSLLTNFDKEFGTLLRELNSINSQIFANASFWKISDLSTIYNQILSELPGGELYVLKDADKLNDLRSQILLRSDSLKLYKKLDGKFDPKAIVLEDLNAFKKGLTHSVDEPTKDKNTDADIAIVNSQEFKRFDAQRLQLLGLFDKRIF